MCKLKGLSTGTIVFLAVLFLVFLIVFLVWMATNYNNVLGLLNIFSEGATVS